MGQRDQEHAFASIFSALTSRLHRRGREEGSLPLAFARMVHGGDALQDIRRHASRHPFALLLVEAMPDYVARRAGGRSPFSPWHWFWIDDDIFSECPRSRSGHCARTGVAGAAFGRGHGDPVLRGAIRPATAPCGRSIRAGISVLFGRFTQRADFRRVGLALDETGQMGTLMPLLGVGFFLINLAPVWESCRWSG